MTTISQLTPEEFKGLLDAYFAPAKQRTQMTELEILELAQRLNKKINVPILNETKEEKILVKIVFKIDRFLYDNLPNEFYELARSLDKGIDDNEARRLTKRLSKMANSAIDIPYIPEQMEYIAIRFVIGVIINAARKKWDFLKAKEALEKADIPNSKNANDKALEAIILN